MLILTVVLLVTGVMRSSARAAPLLPRFVSQPSLSDTLAAIDVGNRAYVAALVSHDADAFGRLFTADAVSMPSHMPLVRGRDEIVESMRMVFEHMQFDEGRIRTITAHVEGNSATEIGSYRFLVSVSGDKRELRGRYLVVWRRVDAAWLIAVDSWQPDAPAN